MGGGHNSKEFLKLKKLRTALKDQFAKMEKTFLDVPLDDTVFEEFDRLKKFVSATEKAADRALLESEKFLNENSIQTSGNDTPPAVMTLSASRTNGSTPAKPSKDPARTAARPIFGDQNRKLEHKIQDLQDSRICKICMDQEMSQLLNPCNHVVCCNNCEIIRLKKRLTVYEDQNSKQRHQIVGLQESLESFGDQNLRLDHKNQELQDSRLCKICMDQEVSQLLNPCNHVVCCNNCINRIQECPICRTNIESSKLIYFS